MSNNEKTFFMWKGELDLLGDGFTLDFSLKKGSFPLFVKRNVLSRCDPG